MKRLALAVSATLLLTTCAAYNAQHASADPKPARVVATSDSAAEAVARTEAAHHHAEAPVNPAVAAAFSTAPMSTKQAMLISELDKFQEELAANGLYDCCVKPACRQCAITAGECHCRRVIDANGPCCGECTQSWVEGRGNTEGVDREQVLAHLGCVRELYEKKTPEGIVPPGQRKDQ
jgi:hypothetical protein